MRNRQRGVALITAVLMVALATILAVNIGFKGFVDQRRSGTVFALDQAFEVAMGAEAWAADTLLEDSRESAKQDTLAEKWATPIPPLPIDGGEIEGFLEDMQGRFNLNSLIDVSTGQPNKDAVAQFQRLLELAGVEPTWANKVVDWIDVNSVETVPDGAEDGVYTAQVPPYLPPNMPITRPSELLALVGFGIDRYRKIEPYVTALPPDAKINVCTAPAAVLDSLTPNQKEFTNVDAATLTRDRTEGCFPNLTTLKGGLSTEAQNYLSSAASETSRYFRATVWVTIGTTQFTLYSLLQRDAGGGVRTISRSFGTY